MIRSHLQPRNLYRQMDPTQYQDYWDHHGWWWWWWWWWYLTTTEHYNHAFSLNPHTHPVTQVLLHHHLIEERIKALEWNDFLQFAQLINGKAWILVPKALSIMIFHVPRGWFSRLLSFQNLYDDRENTCFLLLEKLMSHLESRTPNKGFQLMLWLCQKEKILL